VFSASVESFHLLKTYFTEHQEHPLFLVPIKLQRATCIHWSEVSFSSISPHCIFGLRRFLP